jgi:hypothetical protein
MRTGKANLPLHGGKALNSAKITASEKKRAFRRLGEV